jgi:hypothetical protein
MRCSGVVRSLALAPVLALFACAGGRGEPTVEVEAKTSAQTEVVEAPAIPSSSAVPPALATSTSAAPERVAKPATCEPEDPPAGYEDCNPIEVVGGPPCELECWRPRPVSKPDSCCKNPVHGAIFSKGKPLVEADACKYVDPSCAHFEVKSVEAGFHFYRDSDPREVLLVQGGCEMRAMSHGYVPPGVAAWTGCTVAKRFRWNGTRFTPVPQ